MRILIVGSGGREHALAWRLGQEAEVLVAPGNAGIGAEFDQFALRPNDAVGIEALARRVEADLVVVGPEDPLIEGLADRLRLAGLAVLGPGSAGAQLEGSKAFSKELMLAAGVPTAQHATFQDAESAVDYARARYDEGSRLVVKASGAALGKGVVVCPTYDEAEDAIGRMLVEGELGAAGSTVVLEELLEGREFSLLTIVSGRNYQSLPVAQDYKRALDGDKGPNTGGMGSFSPVGWLDDGLVEETERTVVEPILSELAARDIDFRGVLFSGLMVASGRPMCLEYNVRFGDPETQSVLRRVKGPLADALLAAAIGEPMPALSAAPYAAATVVMASKGYPGAYSKGSPIRVGEMPPGVLVFHSGTALDGGAIVSSGGRVLGVSAIGQTAVEARERAYAGVANIEAPGLWFRHDIGA